jgi:hypothetical protein
MIAKRIFLALTLAAIVTLSTTDLRAQSGEPPTTQETAQESQEAASNRYCGWLCELRERQAQQLEGSWVVTVTPVVPPGVPQPPSFRAYATIARGGAFIGTDTRRLFNIQHGAWAHTGGNEFAWTFIEEVVDAMGNFREAAPCFDEMFRPKSAHMFRERNSADIKSQRPSKAPGAFNRRQLQPGRTNLDAR